MTRPPRLLAMLLGVAGLAGPGCDGAASPADDLRLASPDGLFTARYPRSFEARTLGKTLLLQRSVQDRAGRHDAFILLAADASPQGELEEISQRFEAGMNGTLEEYATVASGPATCNGAAGIEETGRFLLGDKRRPYLKRSCAFLRGGRAYHFSYWLPAEMADSDGPVLRRIVEATELPP